MLLLSLDSTERLGMERSAFKLWSWSTLDEIWSTMSAAKVDLSVKESSGFKLKTDDALVTDELKKKINW